MGLVESAMGKAAVRADETEGEQAEASESFELEPEGLEDDADPMEQQVA